MMFFINNLELSQRVSLFTHHAELLLSTLYRTQSSRGCFFSVWVFFHKHSRFTGQQGKGESIYLTPLYHFHPLHRHLDISRAIMQRVHIASSRTRTENLRFPSARSQGVFLWRYSVKKLQPVSLIKKGLRCRCLLVSIQY